LDTQTIVPGTAESRRSAGPIADETGVNHAAPEHNGDHVAASNGVASNGAASNGAASNGASNGATNGVVPNGAASNGALRGVNGAAANESNKDQEMVLHGMTPTGLARRLGRCS
jgi:hypothetical protein